MKTERSASGRERLPRFRRLIDRRSVRSGGLCIYDYLLGGHHNFAVDRIAAEQVVRAYPDFPLIIAANRAFLRRAIVALGNAGVRQFLDLGSGIPTVGNVHEVLDRMNASARVVYVDIDPVAVATSRSILSGRTDATALCADALKTQEVIGHPDVRRLVHLDEPVAVLLVAFLHFVIDDRVAHEVVRAYRDWMPAGSYLVITHMVPAEANHVGQQSRAADVYSRSTAPIAARTFDEVGRFFDGLEYISPGLVAIPSWRPESAEDLLSDAPWRANMVGGVACKR
jgi:hypothetical protein